MRVVIQRSLFGLQIIKTPLRLPTIFKKHSVGLPLLTPNNKLPSWKNMEQQQNNMCFFFLFVVGVLVVLMFFLFFSLSFLCGSSSSTSYLWRIPASELPALARIPKKISAKCPWKFNLSAAFQKWRLCTPLINLTYC